MDNDRSSKRIVIWGAAYHGIRLKTIMDFDKNHNYEVVCFGDNNEARREDTIDMLRIYGLEEIQSLYQKGEICSVWIAVRNESVEDIVQQLHSACIFEIYILPFYEYEKKISEVELSKAIKIDAEKPRLKYLEIQIADHCNLNCRGCGHFSNLVSHPVFADIKQYEKDLRRIRELVWGIERMDLLGGEPLLNPDLKEFIIITRNLFPDTELLVLTNGLLIESVDELLLETMHEYDCTIAISNYPVTESHHSKIRWRCDEYGVKCFFSPRVKQFVRRINIHGDSNYKEIYKTCDVNWCTTLRNGTLSICPKPSYFSIFNEYFNECVEITEQDRIDLYEENLDGKKLIQRLRQPIPLCRYCGSPVEPYEWKCGGDINRSDWLVGRDTCE